jgi:hypothetical protein
MNGAPIMGWSGCEGYRRRWATRFQMWAIRLSFLYRTVGHGWMAAYGIDRKIELFPDVHDRTTQHPCYFYNHVSRLM